MKRFLNSVSSIGVKIRSALMAAAVIPSLVLGGVPAVPTATAVTSAVTSVVSSGVSLVAANAVPAAIAVAIVAPSSAFAQTDPPSGGENGPQMGDFPKFFDFQSLVTKATTFVGEVGVIALAAVAGWTMIKSWFNFFLRRMRG